MTYRFTTKEHLAIFAKDPEKFIPTYGGWCACAVAAPDTRTLWLKTPDSLPARAEAN